MKHGQVLGDTCQPRRVCGLCSRWVPIPSQGIRKLRLTWKYLLGLKIATVDLENNEENVETSA